MACEIVPNIDGCQLLQAYAVGQLRNQVFSSVDWLDKAYPLVDTGIRKNGEKDYKYPRLLTGICPDQYRDLFPDTKNRDESYCFFEINGNVEDDIATDTIGFQIRCVFWVKQVETYDRTQFYIAEIMNRVRSSASWLITKQAVELDKLAIWNKYSYTFNDLRFVEHPYTTFAFTWTVRIEGGDQCLDDCYELPE